MTSLKTDNNPFSRKLSVGARHSVRGLAVCLSFVLAACSSTPVKNERPDEEASGSPQSNTAERPNINIAAVGDIMLGTDFPHQRLPHNDASLLAPISHVLRAADLTIGNLEGVLQDGGEPVKRCSNINSCYLFRTPTRYAMHLKQAGFDVMSLANNHARDFGEEGRDSSMSSLQAAGILHSGREGDIASMEVKGSKVGVIAYAPYQGSNNMLALQRAREQVGQLAASHDIVVVSFHGGAEGDEHTRIPFARELYYGEDRGDVVEFAHAVIDAGADLVIGHGPHVPRAVELYKQRLVAYSLGNFATYWGIKISGMNGLAPVLTAELDADGRFVRGQLFSARQQRPDGTVPDKQHAAARMMRRLTLSDFPDTPLTIDERGNIRLATPAAVSGAPPEFSPDKPNTSIAQTEE